MSKAQVAQLHPKASDDMNLPSAALLKSLADVRMWFAAEGPRCSR